MADEAEDAAEITVICGGLNLNIGTLNRRTIEGMFAAGRRAKGLGHPVLLDPVGAGASTLRTRTALEIMEKIRPDVIRGNISEIRTLWENRPGRSRKTGKNRCLPEPTRGVDADIKDAVTEENLEEGIAFAKAFAKEIGCIVAITGAIDLVSDGDSCYVIRNGRAQMSRITGTGCQLSGPDVCICYGQSGTEACGGSGLGLRHGTGRGDRMEPHEGRGRQCHLPESDH